MSYKIISFASLYSCMVFTIGAYSSIIQLAEEFQMILEQNGYRFSQTLCSVAMMVMLINWLIVPLVFWFSIGKFIRFINSVGVFQVIYNMMYACYLINKYILTYARTHTYYLIDICQSELSKLARQQLPHNLLWYRSIFNFSNLW